MNTQPTKDTDTNRGSRGQGKPRVRQPFVFILVFVACSALYPFLVDRMNLILLAIAESRPQPSSHVIGNLGGVPVRIPRVYARFLSYNGDPAFMDKADWEPPERTYESRIRGFGFETRFPDMASVDQREPWERNIHTTMWIRVIIKSGDYYGSQGDSSLDNNTERLLSRRSTCNPGGCFYYVLMPDKVFGLVGYTPKGPAIKYWREDPESGSGTDARDENIYVLENDNDVVTLIICSNETHAAAPCKHRFNLGPRMKAHVSVSYRKGLLPHWQEIQRKVSDLIFSFEVEGKMNTKPGK